MITFQAIMVALALITTFVVGVWVGPENMPRWALYASMAIMALGGGAAINLILTH